MCCAAEETRSCHCKHSPEPSFSIHHMLKSFVSFVKWEFLDHAIDVVQLGEFHCFLAIERLARRPAMHGGPVLDKGKGVDLNLTDGYCPLASVSTGVNSDLRAKRTSFPCDPRPLIKSPMIFGIGAVDTIILAPPIFCNASA